MMTEVTSGSQRSEAIGAQVGVAGATTKDAAPSSDFAAVLQQTADTSPSKSASATDNSQKMPTQSLLNKRDEDAAASTVKAPLIVTGSTIHSANPKKDVNAKQETVLPQDGDSVAPTALPNPSSVTNLPDHPLDEVLQMSSKDNVPSADSQVHESSGQAIAVANPQPGKSLTVSQKPPSGAMTTNPVAKTPKIVVKPASPTVPLQTADVVPGIVTPQTLQQGMLLPVASVGPQVEAAENAQRPSTTASALPQVGSTVGATTRPALPDLHSNAAQKSDLASFDQAVSTAAPASPGDDRLNRSSLALMPVPGVESNATVTSTGMFPSSFPGETRAVQAVSLADPIRPLGQHTTSPDLPVSEHAQQAVLQHTVLATTPTSLEIGVYGGTHGWLKIRAELAGNGEVNASLRGASPATANVLPALNAYLQSERIQVGTLSVHTNLEVSHRADRLSEGAANDPTGSSSGNTADRGTRQGEGQSAHFATQEGEVTTSEETDERTVMGVYGLGVGGGGGNTLLPIEYGADGNWLNVRA